MDYSPPGSFVHRILQPRILEWVSHSLLQGIFPIRDQIQVSCIEGRFVIIWAIREAPLYINTFKIIKWHTDGMRQNFIRSRPPWILINSSLHECHRWDPIGRVREEKIPLLFLFTLSLQLLQLFILSSSTVFIFVSYHKSFVYWGW